MAREEHEENIRVEYGIPQLRRAVDVVDVEPYPQLWHHVLQHLLHVVHLVLP